MNDVPRARTASYSILNEGYVEPGTASTVGLVIDGGVVIVTDPGMVSHRDAILDPLREAGLTPEAITDVIFSHHHPDHTLNAALFPEARFHDHWAIYKGDDWLWRDAEQFSLSESVQLIKTPGHTPQDITTLVGTSDGIVAFTHLWNFSDAQGDRHATDLDALHEGRRRVLSIADIIVPGHGPAFRPTADTPL